MRRHLQLKREVLVDLATNELEQVVGATLQTVLLSGDVCIENSRKICLTDTCLTDLNCGELTRYCTSRAAGGC